MASEAPAVERKVDEEAGPGDLLEQGLRYFYSQDDKSAAEAFRAAVETDDLNDAGRALAYWHISMSERRLGDADTSADTLNAFVSVAEEILEVRAEVRYAVSDSGDFVDRFDLPNKLDRARALLAVAWSDRAPGYGRTVEHPVLVRSDSEVSYFLELTAPCGDEETRSVSRHPSASPGVEEVSLSCGEGSAQNVWFFTLDAR